MTQRMFYNNCIKYAAGLLTANQVEDLYCEVLEKPDELDTLVMLVTLYHLRKDRSYFT